MSIHTFRPTKERLKISCRRDISKSNTLGPYGFVAYGHASSNFWFTHPSLASNLTGGSVKSILAGRMDHCDGHALAQLRAC